MAPGRKMNRPIRPEAFSDDEDFNDLDSQDGEGVIVQDEQEEESSDVDSEDHEDENSVNTGGSNADSTPETTASDVKDADHNDTQDDPPTLDDISFGALAQAAATLAPSRSRKRKHSELDTNPQPHSESTNTPSTDPPFKPTKPPPPSTRTSKHAPQILTSRKPVSRRREIFSPPPSTLRARDPRFDPTITSSSLRTNQISSNKNYSFLKTYQTSEITSLKSQLNSPASKASPELQASLKREIMSLEAKVRNAEDRAKEEEILRKHREDEGRAIREGRKEKAFYLKKGAVRKMVERERVEGLSKKAREKREVRRGKREKGREGRGMPRVRRARVDG